jgi:hypothetical protein
MARSWGGRSAEEGVLGAKVLKRLLAGKKPEGSLCARVLKSSDGRQYNGKRDREERQASKQDTTR